MKNRTTLWRTVAIIMTIGIFLVSGGACGTETPKTTAPTVSSTNPANGATGVAIDSAITATFSKTMDPLTVTNMTFTLKQGTTAVAGAVTYASVTATFRPDVVLAADTEYTATTTTGVKDLAGNALAVDKVWSFSTGAAPDTTAPTVSSTNPANAATEVAINSAVSATFSEAMNALTVTNATFTLKQGTTAVAGTVAYAGVTAIFTPDVVLAADTEYTATITTGVKDLAGNALAVDKVWSFTTGATSDTTAPTVVSTNPANAATGVAINSAVSATFSEAMNALTVTNVTFTLKQGTTAVAGTVTYAGVTAIFTPNVVLEADTEYTATITTGVKDLAGNALAVDKVWSFTSGAASDIAPVDLGTAANYVILAKTAISTVPGSAIVGDVGLSPAATSYITGFSLTLVGTTSATSTQVTGTIYGADMTTPTNSNLTTAVSDMETAYTDAAGRSTPDFLNLGAGEIGGLTLAPGLYTWTTGVTISTDVTLSGGPNDVWIFQIPGDLIMSSAKNVFLSGGAQAKNIFWQVAGYVDIGTTAHFEGIILCQTEITMKTGASINGRLLAQTDVNLDQNEVTRPD